jgi:hypothetical protein
MAKTKVETVTCDHCNGSGVHYTGDNPSQHSGESWGCSKCGGDGILGSSIVKLKKGSGKVRQTYEYNDERKSWSASGSTPSNGCFPKGTKVLTPNGLVDISVLIKGDLVISINKNGEKVTNHIVKYIKHNGNQIWEILLSNGSVIRTTRIHSFQVYGKWKKASNIVKGETIKDFINNKELKVISSSITIEKEDVYNLIVDNNYNFIANSIVAHSFTRFRIGRVIFWSIYGFFCTKLKSIYLFSKYNINRYLVNYS